MGNAIHFSDLRALGGADRKNALEAVMREALAPTNGQAFVIRAKIQAYEARYEMTSAQMRQGLIDHSVRETAEVSDWLFWLRLRDLCGG
jgi:hypothetical protein